MTEYFYRKIGSAVFEPSDTEKVLLPVRLKNKYVLQPQFYNNETKQWTDYDGDYDTLLASDTKLFPVEYAEQPFNVSFPRLFGTIEEYSPSQMRKYLAYRRKKEQRNFYAEHYYDENDFEKNLVCVRMELDEENLSLKVTSLYFKRNPTEDNEIPEPGIPSIIEKSYFFDVLNGNVESDLNYFEHEDSSDDDFFPSRPAYEKELLNVTEFFKVEIPDCLKVEVFRNLLKLIHLYTEIPYERLCEKYSELMRIVGNPEYSIESEKERERERAISTLSEEMYLLTILPYEPALYKILMKQATERKFNFSFRRDDPEIFKAYCRKFKIKNTRTVRRCYTERPDTLRTYLRLKDCGFRDINLYNRILENAQYYNLIDKLEPQGLIFFARYSIRKRGQKATCNILLKPAEDKKMRLMFWMNDGMNMFHRYFKNIPHSLRQAILHDGFTEYNHDALSGVAYHCNHKKITFTYTPEQRSLCDSIEGYEFCIPKDNYQLFEIGAALSNCVGSYDESVAAKECTIVYVTKDGEYKICIEVRGNEIIQERVKYNADPSEAEQKILDEWHLRHKLLLV